MARLARGAAMGGFDERAARDLDKDRVHHKLLSRPKHSAP
jgi:hypothetical protein